MITLFSFLVAVNIYLGVLNLLLLNSIYITAFNFAAAVFCFVIAIGTFIKM